MKYKVTFAVVLSTIILISLSGCNSKKELSRLETGMKLLHELNYEEANKSFEAAVANGENAQKAYRGAGLANLAMANYEDAESAFEHALQESNGIVGDMEYDISYYLALTEYKSGQLDRAYETYSAIIAMDEKSEKAYYLRGSTALKNNQYELAMSDFNQAITLAPKDHDLYIRIYENLSEMGYEEDGKIFLKKALEGDTKMSIYQQGKFYYYLGQYEDARNSFEQAAKSIDTVEMILFLGRTYEAMGDVNYAASLYDNYLQKHEGAAPVYNQLGICRLGSKEYEQALAAFEAGIALEDESLMQSLKYNEIVAHEYLCDFKKAAVLMSEYLKKYPDDAKAIRENDFLKSR
ncbi:MAG: tetratricopeptide repeat protein [Clostridia bacterium]|nr:tetratricopeptide repeat protein [Clostridia bacterium]